MHRFFVPLEQIGETKVWITGSDVHHIEHVLRLKEGERVALLDGRGSVYTCRLSAFKKDEIEAVIEEQADVREELPSRLFLFQGMPKRDKMEWIVQKAVELGAYSVIPVRMERSVVKLDDKQAEKKTARYQSIAESAAKQASRGVIPMIEKPVSFSEALKMAGKLDHIILPYELAENMKETRDVFQAICPGESVGIFIGPEGGFSEKEVQSAMEQGAKVVTLGKRILRTETAPLAVLSILMYLLETD